MEKGLETKDYELGIRDKGLETRLISIMSKPIKL